MKHRITTVLALWRKDIKTTWVFNGIVFIVAFSGYYSLSFLASLIIILLINAQVLLLNCLFVKPEKQIS